MEKIRWKKIGIQLLIRGSIVVLILILMLVLSESIISSFPGSFGTPNEGAAVLLTLVVVISGIMGIIFVCLYKTSWIEGKEIK